MSYAPNSSDLLKSVGRAAEKFRGKDFLLTWDHDKDILEGVLAAATLIERRYREGKSNKCFDAGLAISIFRDQSTRTRFAFASAVNLLGLALQELDEKKSQIAHGETVRETANMIAFTAQAIGIRDDMFIHEGHKYMVEVAEAVTEGHKAGVLAQRPCLVNLQCDLDHPTQSMSDLLHLINHFGGPDKIKGKKIAMSWAYSPSYGKPLSVPQGIITLLPRFGVDVTLAHPKGYDLLPETIAIAKKGAAEGGGAFRQVESMEEAFAGADIVYPKSWAPFHVMEKRTEALRKGDSNAVKELEKTCLADNAKHKDWTCDEAKMKKTKDGKALYMHCLPADISGVSCTEGEVAADVFERYRLTTYREAAYKPFVIAAMMLLSKAKDAQKILG